MKNIFKIWKNELIAMLKDPGTLLIMVIGALLYSIFYSVPYSTHILRDVPIGVVDLDNSPLSRELIRDLDSNEFIAVASRPLDVNDAKQQFYANKIRGYVLIPKDFERHILRGGNTSLALYDDSSYILMYKQITTGVLTTTSTLGARLEIGKFMKKGLSKKQAMMIKLPFDFVSMPLYNPVGSYENYIYPLVLVLILQQTMLVGAGLLGGTVREQMAGRKKWVNGEVVELKKEKFCDFSDVPATIVFGKGLAYFSLYMCHSLIYFLIFPAVFVYKMTYNLGLLFMILIPYLLSVAFLAQALIYFFKERENSLLMLVVVSLPLIFLPGFVWPKESIPLWLLHVSKFIPASPAIDALTRVNQMGAHFYQIQSDFWLLVVLCALYFFLACNVTKKLCK